jgi:hypothetical protein
MRLSGREQIGTGAKSFAETAKPLFIGSIPIAASIHPTDSMLCEKQLGSPFFVWVTVGVTSLPLIMAPHLASLPRLLRERTPSHRQAHLGMVIRMIPTTESRLEIV